MGNSPEAGRQAPRPAPMRRMSSNTTPKRGIPMLKLSSLYASVSVVCLSVMASVGLTAQADAAANCIKGDR